MANDFSAEIKRWNAVASSYEKKRANLRPISFDFTSKAYSNAGNYNGASTFNSARAKLAADDVMMRSRMTYDPPAKAGTVATHNTVLKPSTDVIKASAQVDTVENKIKELGGNAFRSAVGGLVRAADLISRTGYAIRSSSMTYAKENAAGGTTIAEHAQNALAPIFDIATMIPRGAVNAATGRSEATYSAMWQGFSGKQKTSGRDLLKVAFPEFTSDHKKWTSVLSFGVDVVYDPLSWVTVGQGTVVSGGAKAVAAGGAAAVGKKTVAKNLLANTVWTKTGREGGMEALKNDLYLRAAKPVLKQNKKATKELNKATKSYVKAATAGAKGGDKAKEVSAFTRVEKARQVKADVEVAQAAKLAEIQSQSFEGMQLAWKAVARKSLGLSSIQAYGKGVNTAGTAGRAAREFKALQDLNHTEILDRFKSASSPESHAWRTSHLDIVESGNRQFTWKGADGKTKTFEVPDDYDDFIDKFGEIAFPKHSVTAVTKADSGMRRGTIAKQDAEAKRFFQAFNNHVDLTKGKGRGSKDLISPYRAGAAGDLMSHADAVKEMEQSVEGLQAGKERLLAARPNETDAMYRTRILDEAANAAEEGNPALAQTLRAGAEQLRPTAQADEAAIMDEADRWLQVQGEAIGSTEARIEAALSAQDNVTASMDQINGRGLGTVLTRDEISANTQAKVQELIDQMNAGVGEVVVGANGTMEGNKITKMPGFMDDAKNPKTGQSPAYQRQVNYEIAKAIQEVNEAAKSMLVADALTNDYELAWDMIQQNTNTILNSLFGATHVEVFNYLNEMGYSVLADTPNTEAFLQHMVKLMGDTFTPMSEALAKPTLKTDVRMTGSKGKYEVPSAGMEKLRKQVPRTLQNTHNTVMELFRMGNNDFSWDKMVADVDIMINRAGMNKTLDYLVEQVSKLAVERGANRYVNLPNKPQVRLAGESDLVSVSDVVLEWSTLALGILRQTHTADNPSLGHYTLYDYFAFSGGSGKETAPITRTTGLKTTPDKAQLGRAGYLGTRQKMQATLQESGIIGEALDTIPAMDERMVELTSQVRGFLAGRGEFAVSDYTNVRATLRDAIAEMLIPDLKKISDVESGFEEIIPMELMKSLGAHVQLLSDTTARIDTAAQVALGSEVWGRATKIRQLNESIMLFNLHNTLVEALGAEKAAARIAEIIKTRPSIEELMSGAHQAGTTNGNAGLRTPPAADIGHIKAQADRAAEEAAKAWDAANPVKAADTTAEALKGKHTDAVLAELEPVRAKVDNPPIAIADKLDVITEEQAMGIKFLGERNKIKVYEVPDSDLVVMRAPTNSEGKNFTFVMTKDEAAISMEGGKFKPNPKNVLGVPLKYADGENDDFLREFVIQISGAKNTPTAPAVDDVARKAARQAEYDRVYAAKMEELKPAVVEQSAAVAANRAALSQELASKQQAATNSAEKQLADATLAADAAKQKQTTAQVTKSNFDPIEQADNAVVDAAATDARVAKATDTPDRQWNQPGGYYTPEMTDAAIAEIDSMIDELLGKIDIAKINESIAFAQATMNQGMADYAQLMKAAASNFDVNTRYMLKFAGIPIMPVATAHSPMAAYAGMVAMKESQGVAANWLAQREWAKWANSWLRRPSSMHDNTLNQMRLSVANSAQNAIYVVHKSISETYSAYRDKAVLKADVKAFWDDGATDVAKGLAPLSDRLLAVENELAARGARAARLNTPVDMWEAEDFARHRIEARDQAKILNDMLPGYKLPEGVLSGPRRFDPDNNAGAPWSRGWLLELSKYLDGAYPSHPLAKRNVGNINMATFDDAVQRAFINMQQETMLADSMFEAFSFKFTDPKHVDVLNASLPESQQYVPLASLIPTAKIYDLTGQYVAADFGDEMVKVLSYYQGMVTGRGSELNFKTLGMINNHWKAMVTAWNIPKYHIGNVMSDGFLGFMDGVGPKAYGKATSVMKNSYIKFRTEAMDPEVAENVLRKPNMGFEDVVDDPEVAAGAARLAGEGPGKIVSSVRINGQHVNITAEDYYKAYSDFGLGENAIKGNLELTQGNATYKKAMDAVVDWSSVREDYFRIAHFIHAVENEALIPGRTQQEIFKAARDRVVKYHFDYGDVSEIERLSVGRVMPFYKWTRNIVPLSMSMLITNPKAYVINNAANKAMGEMMYPTQEDANGNTIPVAYITPNFVGQQNSVPIGHYTDPEGNEQARYAVLNLPMDQALANWVMPFLDPWFDPTLSPTQKLNEGAKGVVTSMLGSSGPAIKGAVMAATGKSPAQGGEAYPVSDMQWLTSPLTAVIPQWTPGIGAMAQLYKKNSAQGTTGGYAWGMDNILGVTRETAATDANVKGTLNVEKKRLEGQLKKEAGIWMQNNFPDVPADSEEGKKILHDFYVERGVVSK